MLPAFKATGYDLFQDGGGLGSDSITGDIFSTMDNLAKTTGTWDIVHITIFLYMLPLRELGEHRTVFRESEGTIKVIWERARRVGAQVDVWAGYDNDEVRQRAEKREQRGQEWEKQEKFFAGKSERKIFFRVDMIQAVNILVARISGHLYKNVLFHILVQKQLPGILLDCN